ncbi:5'-methylthioadenosine/S-adenosylhomocysteine nucleosidase family protein [Actinomadura roseirufa]|uniref:5'-methylthioadenosine/S-adenosylhomocysteine nucleosidase family protein n=1 Tax=Actinomadura roseirufa TaxID=2094049 RepID=UPI001F5E942C|nr:hypothetical protein [Actinomadura roseirufa]
MNKTPRVNGILNTGGTMAVTNSAVGNRPTVNLGTSAEHRGGARPQHTDVGIITVLGVETNAVRLALGLQETPVGALRFYTGACGGLKIAAIRALAQGQRSAMAAYENLRRHFDPKIMVLAGIGGGIHGDVAVGDVVVATRVVYYDLRKKTPEGTHRRGEERETSAAVGHAINAFFTDHDPAEFPVEDPGGTRRDLRMFHGPIGSGEAVVADGEADVVRYLASFNNKILALDMEAGGLSQVTHEHSADTGRLHGWVVVRGISDTADASKDDAHHRTASWHAAVALGKLIPYLKTPALPQEAH